MSTIDSTSGASATGKFTISNGQILDPNGTVFTAAGMNVYDAQMGDAATILAKFPGINMVRLNIYSYQDPSAYSAFIKTMTNAGVVVEVEDHLNSNGSNAGGAQGSAFTGSQLSNELNWYSSMASTYASNPYVWFGTNNEPPAEGLSAWEQETYNAIRSTGNENPILMELPGGGVSSLVGAGNGMDSSVYATMSNIVWDPHYYGWFSSFSTDQQAVDNALTSLVQSVQTITSADGTVPVIIGEYGPATDGQNTDPNGDQVLQAVQSSATSGSLAWGWNSGANDNLTDGSGNLTSFGQELANWATSVGRSSTSSTGTASGASGTSSTGSETATSTGSSGAGNAVSGDTIAASANDIVVNAGSTAAITDTSGSAWTIVNGAVQENGQAAGYSADVTQIAYVNGTIWQQNGAGLWWSWNGSNWLGTGTSTSPLTTPLTTVKLDPGTTNATVSQDRTSVASTAGDHMVFVTGSNDTLALSGGTNTVTDDGNGNTYLLPAAGNGVVDFTSNVLVTNGDTLDLRSALAATSWDGTEGTLQNYLAVTNNGADATIAITDPVAGTSTAIASIGGASGLDLATALAHAVT